MADEPLQEKAVIPTASTSIVNVPMPSKEPGQRSINITDLFITRWTPPWSRPPSLPAYTWRAWVMNQPVAIACREVLISLLTGLEWNISARDADDKEVLAPSIKYYTKLLNHGGYYLGTDFTGLMEWVLGDLLDIPFGGAVEIGRKGDDPKGRVVWLRPLDGGTLYPTLNLQFPVVQYYQGYTAVAFPEHAIARLMMTPRPEIFREGWGIAPPEKIYFALDMLNRGDKYYANLLLDVPPAGILDLGDMEENSAKAWVDTFRTFVANTTDAFRIPVLYEHNNEVKFLPFGKVPNDIMFDHITLKYAALTASAYGLSLNDVGLQTTARGGETLAGSIRSQNQTRRTGIARLKTKVKGFIESILPNELMFEFIDYDDEHNVAMGRARLATATGLNLMVTTGALSPEEARMQMLRDGLIDIPIGNELPPEAKKVAQNLQNPPAPGGFGGAGRKPPKNTTALGHGVPPSLGGEGQSNAARSFVKRSKASDARIDKFIEDVSAAIYPQVLTNIFQFSDDEIVISKSLIDESLFSDGVVKVLASFAEGKPKLNLNQGFVENDPDFKSYNLWSDPKRREYFLDRLRDGINGLLAKSIAEELNNVLYDLAVQDISTTTLQSEFSEAADSGVEFDFPSVCEQVRSRVVENLDRTIYYYVRSLIPTQVEEKAELVEKSKPIEEVLEAAPSTPPSQVPDLHQTINFPSINVTVPERSLIIAPPDVQVVNEMAAPQVDVHNPAPMMPDVHVNVESPQIQMPPVNVQVEKSDLQPHITVEAPQVTVNVPEQPAPVVNVEVNPTPVEVKNTVNIPEKESKPKEVRIQKNADGSWSGKSE